MMKKLLITAFEAFGGASYNPTVHILGSFPDVINNNCEIIKAVLPVSYRTAPDMLDALINEYTPTTVISFGLAASREYISIERSAHNVKNAGIADNDGSTECGSEIISGGEGILQTRLPAVALAKHLSAHGVNCRLSDDAGEYVCNTLYYRLLYKCETSNFRTKGIFIHVPPDETYAATEIKDGRNAGDSGYIKSEEILGACVMAAEYLTSEE